MIQPFGEMSFLHAVILLQAIGQSTTGFPERKKEIWLFNTIKNHMYEKVSICCIGSIAVCFMYFIQQTELSNCQQALFC